MYKVINIGGKDYKLEYSIEASLYGDCVTSLTGMMADLGIAEQNKDIKSALKGMGDVPQIALTTFYAGLLEHHGADGDGMVPDKKTAKSLIAKMICEHKDDEMGSFYGILEMCINQMMEDGFFKLVGLEEMLKESSPKKKRTAKTPEDHKKAIENLS